MASALAAVDVKDLARHETRRLKVEDRINDVGNLAHAPDGMKGVEGLMGLYRMHRRLDDAEGDRVHANTALGVFDGEGFGRRVESALRQRGEDRGHGGHRVVDEARGDLDDMAAALLFHLGDGELRGVEEPGGVDAQDGGEVGLGVLGEGLADEDAGVVDERVDAPEPRHALEDRAFRRLSIRDVAGDREDVGVVRRLDRPCRRDYAVIAIAIGLDEGRADASRRARNHGDFPCGAHGEPPMWFRCSNKPRRLRRGRHRAASEPLRRKNSERDLASIGAVA